MLFRSLTSCASCFFCSSLNLIISFKLFLITVISLPKHFCAKSADQIRDFSLRHKPYINNFSDFIIPHNFQKYKHNSKQQPGIRLRNHKFVLNGTNLQVKKGSMFISVKKSFLSCQHHRKMLSSIISQNRFKLFKHTPSGTLTNAAMLYKSAYCNKRCRASQAGCL